MTVSFGFYDSLAGDRFYNAEQMSRIFEGIITDGVFQLIGGALVVSPHAGMGIKVASGRAWFANTWTNNDSDLILVVDPSEVALNRIDRVILEVNKDLGVRANSIKILKGTPASVPVAPTLANTSTLKQYALANISVGLGVTTITGGNITNMVGTVGTPFITGILETIDTATLLSQFEASFQTWFENLQDQLDDNQAGNLQNQIDDLVDAVAALGTGNDDGWIAVSDTWVYASAISVTIPFNGTLTYQKWMKVRFKQGGSFKYFYCTAAGSTSLFLYGGSSYTIANDAITDIAYSFIENPFGFPIWLPYNWTANGGGSMTLTSVNQIVGDFKVTGGELTARISGNATTGGTAHKEIRVTLPLDVANADAVLPQLASTYDGASKLGYAYIFETTTPHKVTILKQDDTVWGLGTLRAFRATIKAKLNP